MNQNYDLFYVYNYDDYSNNFIRWRRETIAKVVELDEDELYFLEDQILRHKGFDAKRFNNNPIVGKLVDFISELVAPFVEKPYRTAFYTQLEAITKRVIKDREELSSYKKLP